MEEPFGEVTADAIRLHEVFESFIQAGFFREEALYLIGQMLHGTSQGR